MSQLPNPARRCDTPATATARCPAMPPRKPAAAPDGLRRARQIVVAVQQDGYTQREMIAGIGRAAQEAGDWSIHYLPALGTDEAAARAGIPWRPDGIIAYSESPAIEAFLRRLGCPCVDLAARQPPYHVPGYDEQAIGRMAAKHLIDRGYPHLASVGIRDGLPDRARGFAAEAKRQRRTVQEFIGTWADVRSPHGAKRFSDWLATLELPCGIFAENDRFAQALCSAASRLGLQVPDELGIIGADADPLLSRLSPVPLSSVRVPYADAGYYAGRALCGLLAGRWEMPPAIQPVDVVECASTTHLTRADPLIGALRRLLDANPAEALGTDALADALGLKRRTLERQVLAATGRSVLKEVQSHRLVAARARLRAQASVGDTARLHGMSLSGFISWFHEAQGMTPGAYRSLWRKTAAQSSRE